jgi:hypothetical protein
MMAFTWLGQTIFGPEPACGDVTAKAVNARPMVRKVEMSFRLEMTIRQQYIY